MAVEQENDPALEAPGRVWKALIAVAILESSYGLTQRQRVAVSTGPERTYPLCGDAVHLGPLLLPIEGVLRSARVWDLVAP